MSSRYEVHEDGRFVRDHLGLIGACVDARNSAGFRPGTLCTVTYGGKLEARYQLVNGKLDRWMR